ncbi:hypothetical protein AB0D13_02955 [Streptomyces sp. NPDC048430]|uniref:hypothetical protein n=1 Tax=unclassified Streptomyces TaxID=2593676 RepID=UPI00342F4C9C
MRITPRKHEYQAVVDILVDPTFESPDQMAKALLKEMGAILQMRDLWVLTHRWADGSKGLNYGPFGSTAEAEAFAKKMSFGGTGRVIPLTSSGIALANHDGKAGWPGYCYNPRCGHPPFMHSSVGASRGQCHLDGCACDKFVKDAPKTKSKK